MPAALRHPKHVLQSADLRILALMVAGAGIFGVVDGSLWKTLLAPTLAYRPAILFGLTLVFGWRGFLWSQLVFSVAFVSFLGWHSSLVIEPMYLLSNAAALFVAQKMAGSEPLLSREKPTLAFLAGAIFAPALPASLNGAVLRTIGVTVRGLPLILDSWLRGAAGILALAPAVLVWCAPQLKQWVGLPVERERRDPIRVRNLLELGVEVAVWTATLWLTVLFKARYGLNITYLTFLPPLAFTLFRGMHLATLALAANGLVATTLWNLLDWSPRKPRCAKAKSISGPWPTRRR